MYILHTNSTSRDHIQFEETSILQSLFGHTLLRPSKKNRLCRI